MEKLKYQLIDGPIIVNSIFSLKEPEVKCKENREVVCSFNFSIDFDSKRSNCTVVMNVKTEEKWVPFSFDVTSKAVLSIDGKGINEKEMAKVGLRSAGPYLFTLTRDFVSELTRKAGLIPFNLPNFDFLTLSEGDFDIESTKEEQKSRKKK